MYCITLSFYKMLEGVFLADLKLPRKKSVGALLPYYTVQIPKYFNLLYYCTINFQITSYGAKTKEPDYAARKADHISHFILRLSFCRTEELRRWFISRELDLFRLRWLNLSTEGKSDFIKINDLNYEPVSLTLIFCSKYICFCKSPKRGKKLTTCTRLLLVTFLYTL